MRKLIAAAKLLLLDMASTLPFSRGFSADRDSAPCGDSDMVLGVAQIGWQFTCERAIATM
jgi:hypothetical protein